MRIIRTIGNKSLWQREKTLFLTSRMVPLTCYESIFQWVEEFDRGQCAVCFNTSELEEEVLKALPGIYPEGNSNPDLVLEYVTAKHSNHMQKQKALYPNAYKPWSEADDALLTKLYKKGTSMKELMSLFQRNRGGIAARLRKLGLT